MLASQEGICSMELVNCGGRIILKRIFDKWNGGHGLGRSEDGDR